MTQYTKKNAENMYNVFEATANIEIYEKNFLLQRTKLMLDFFYPNAVALNVSTLGNYHTK